MPTVEVIVENIRWVAHRLPHLRTWFVEAYGWDEEKGKWLPLPENPSTLPDALIETLAAKAD